MLLSILMYVSCAWIFSMQEGDVVEHVDVECHLCTLWLSCRASDMNLTRHSI